MRMCRYVIDIILRYVPALHEQRLRGSLSLLSVGVRARYARARTGERSPELRDVLIRPELRDVLIRPWRRSRGLAPRCESGREFDGFSTRQLLLLSSRKVDGRE